MAFPICYFSSLGSIENMKGKDRRTTALHLNCEQFLCVKEIAYTTLKSTVDSKSTNYKEIDIDEEKELRAQLGS